MTDFGGDLAGIHCPLLRSLLPSLTSSSSPSLLISTTLLQKHSLYIIFALILYLSFSTPPAFRIAMGSSEGAIFRRSFANMAREMQENHDDDDDDVVTDNEGGVEFDEGQVRPLIEVLSEELEEEQGHLPEAKRTFDDMQKELSKVWTSISHHPGGSEIKLERMLNGEHITVTFSADCNVRGIFICLALSLSLVIMCVCPCSRVSTSFAAFLLLFISLTFLYL